ncbi:hypothetical protein [Acetobacter persici]|uniref:hypothetical protein n=1 Tax=Acetobacter persici TaxID=1076596 RepID=UPI001F210CE5|nr:hypothetical protein [Acetobacter persici]MCG0998149.1 hypothetical protein [Acetobacter persici]
MTDPRIEALIDAIQAEGLSFKHAIHGDDEQAIATRILAAADAAARRSLADQIPPEPVLIMSQHGAAVAQWDMEIDGWRNEDTMYSPRYFTRWQPLPAPPASIAELGGVDG